MRACAVRCPTAWLLFVSRTMGCGRLFVKVKSGEVLASSQWEVVFSTRSEVELDLKAPDDVALKGLRRIVEFNTIFKKTDLTGAGKPSYVWVREVHIVPMHTDHCAWCKSATGHG